MSDKDAATPRETEWSRNGRFTGTTDIPLLPAGEEKVKQTASVVFGPGKLIQPRKLAKIFVSPRTRARKTLELLLGSIPSSDSDGTVDGVTKDLRKKLQENVTVTEDIAEWGYGDYEGLLTNQIRDLRHSRGHESDGKTWDIWRDGTEGSGGEMPSDVATRVDRLIDQITSIQDKVMSQSPQDVPKRDILVVAHGHILRAFVKRWLGLPMDSHVEMMLEPGGVCGLSYAHGHITERAVLVGMSFPGN